MILLTTMISRLLPLLSLSLLLLVVVPLKPASAAFVTPTACRSTIKGSNDILQHRSSLSTISGKMSPSSLWSMMSSNSNGDDNRNKIAAARDNNIDNNENNSNNRRNFLLTSVGTAAAGIFAVTLSTVTPSSIAYAATTTASGESTATIDYKYYRPAQHSLDDQVIVITGGTTGLGLETAKRLAYGGASIVITSRTVAKGADAISAIQQYLKDNDNVANDKLHAVQLNLDDLSNVREFPQRLRSTLVGSTDDKSFKINTLINNAGVMAIPTKEITVDGYERTFQSNHLGHFLLTSQLLPMIQPENGRIINVSSEAHKIPGSNGLQLNNLNGELDYGPWSSYGQSKLANVLFTKELQRRLNEKASSSITAVSLHPGAVQTDLGRNLIGAEKWEQMKDPNYKMSFTDKILLNTLSKFVLTVEEGASTQIYLASADATSNTNNDKRALRGGDYYDKCTSMKLDAFAMDMVKAKALWEKSEQMTGAEFKI